MSEVILTADACPVCDKPDTLTVTRNDAGVLEYVCTTGCTEADIVGKSVAERDEKTKALIARKVARLAPPPTNPLEAVEHLNRLLSLEHDVGVRGARVTGQGSRASVEIDLANGDMMVFDSIRDMTRPALLIAEVAACAGVAVAIKQVQAVQAVVAVRMLAEHTRGLTDNDVALDWGVSYLQLADVLDIDMNDQREKWAAFSNLRGVHIEVQTAAADGSQGSSDAVGRASRVLRAQDGARYVRTGWFQSYVKRLDSTVSQRQVATRMLRVGWITRSNSGQIKATRPGYKDTLSWSFLIVPPGWEDGR